MTELDPMGNMRASGRWSRFASRIRTQYASLNDEDLEPYMGNREELIDQISTRTKQPRHEVEQHIDTIVTEEGDIWLVEEVH
ncbi:MAG: hypothetical protein RhofKO_13480 [Rhodothermales bacterium]